MYKTSLGSVTAEIEDLLVEKMAAKGRNLNQKLKSAGRRLPRKIRAQVAYLVEAEARCDNAKRAHQYDPIRVMEARKQCVSHLEKIDKNAARDRRRRGWFTGLVVNLFVLLILFIVVASFVG
ncbi:MAG: hypothetical protein ACJAXU_002224 [Paracoccaceae bacterium]|jgi:hypothetical protein